MIQDLKKKMEEKRQKEDSEPAPQSGDRDTDRLHTLTGQKNCYGLTY